MCGIGRLDTMIGLIDQFRTIERSQKVDDGRFPDWFRRGLCSFPTAARGRVGRLRFAFEQLWLNKPAFHVIEFALIPSSWSL
jgi:hypothetical protein